MEIPDNCQCYCYAIMSSLCFPCQVKIHLLHLTGSPHGELTKYTKCPRTETRAHAFRTDPKDRSQTPQSTGKNSSQTPTSPTSENYAKTDCDQCYYYMNFINKLTSGLCEEKIMRMVCSNPCLISSDLPAVPGDRRNDFPPPTPGLDVPPLSHANDNVFTNNANDANNQRIPSKTSARSNTSTGIKAKEHPVPGLVMEETTTLVFVNNQVPAANHSSKEKVEISPEKKPATPTNLMTTDKMLRKSFDAISKNRPSPISSRSPSPVHKRPEIKQSTTKVDNKLTKIHNAPKNDSKLAKRDIRTPTFQRNPPNSTPSKAPKNEPTVQRQMAVKEVGKRLLNNNGKGSVVSEKMKSTDTSKTRTAPTKLKWKPPESALKSLINTGEGHDVQFPTEGGTMKIAENEKGPTDAMEMGANKADGSEPMGGFFEAALVMEFYQPPQLGSRDTGANPAAKQLHMENEVRNRTEYNQRELSEQKGCEKQQATQERSPLADHAIPEEHVEYLPLVRDDIVSKNKKPAKSKSSNSSTKKEDKARKKSRTSDPKRHDVSSWKGASQAPISPQVGNHVLDRATFHTYDTAPDTDKPVGNNDINGRDLGECEPGFQQTYFDHAGQRDESRRPMHISMGRDVQEECPQIAGAIKGTAEFNHDRRTSESRRDSMYNNTNKVVKQRGAYEFSSGATYMTEGMVHVNTTKNAEEETPERKNIDARDAREIVPGAPYGMKYIPNASQRSRKDRRKTNDNNDKERDQVDDTERTGEQTTGREVDTKEPRGRFSTDEPCSAPLNAGIVKKIREEIESEYRQKYDTEHSPKPKKQVDETPKPLSDARQSPNSDDRSSRSGSQKKSRSSNQRHRSASGNSMDDFTKVYPQFSEYMNPDAEGYRSKSAGNLVETHSAHDIIPPAKCRSERGSSKWNCGVCPDDKRVYYHTDSDGKCTSMVIGLPQDGRNSNPHIRINFNKQVKQEITCCKVDKCEQKNDYRDTGTQYDNDILEANSPAGSRPATAKSSNNRIPPKTTAKPLQSSGQISSAKTTQTAGHQQMYYNRPLMRRSFH